MIEHEIKNIDIDAGLSRPRFDPNLNNLANPDILMNKLQHQKQLEEALAQTQLNDNNTTEMPFSKSMQYLDSVEKQLSGETHAYQRKPKGSFIDPDTGEETLYVKNISNGHVVISDLDMETIRVGSVVDLLEMAEMDDLKKSKDLRRAMNGGAGRTRFLERLTPEEYDMIVEQKSMQSRKIENYKKNQELRVKAGIGTDPKKQVSGRVRSMLEKLRLASESIVPEKGITPYEFMDWVASADLPIHDLDYILATVQENEIRVFILEQKKIKQQIESR